MRATPRTGAQQTLGFALTAPGYRMRDVNFVGSARPSYMPRLHRTLLPALILMLGATVTGQQRNITALVGGTIYSSPSATPITGGIVLVEDGKITAVGSDRAVQVPSQAKVVNCEGMFVLAGFQNSHVHFTPPGWTVEPNAPAEQVWQRLAAMLTGWGFTTVVDTGSEPTSTVQLRKRIESGEMGGPRILTAGLPLYPPNGLPFYLDDLPAELLKALPRPTTAGEASTIVSDPTGYRDLVKLFVGSWVSRQQVLPMPQDIASAAARTAHKAGKLAFAHPSNVAGLNIALSARVDVLAHALDNTAGLTDAHFRQMKRQNMAMVPTLKLFQGEPDVVAEVRAFFKIGGQILFGTDVGYLSDVDPTYEYELLARAGLGWRDILASLTTSPAARFGESRKRGQIVNGMDADLVVLRTDPAADVRAFANVMYTFRRGNEIYRRLN
jgi:imidazolonepropionase-like amidohydrolase